MHHQMRASLERVPSEYGRFFYQKKRADPEFDFRWHYHPEFELTLIGQSRGRRFVGDHIGDYGEGDLVLLGPNLPHTWCSAPADKGKRHDAWVIQFSEDMLGKNRFDGVKLAPVRALLERSARGIQFTGAIRDEVATRMMRIQGLSPLLQLSELLVILDLLSGTAEGTVLSSQTLVPQIAPEATHPVDKACKYINDHYLERIPLGTIARVLAMSPSAFSRFFHRTTGKTFVGYVNELRIGHSCQLLMDTERGIADIAGASGFSNLSQFNRCFLRVKGQRPSEFRKEHRRYRVMKVATG